MSGRTLLLVLGLGLALVGTSAPLPSVAQEPASAPEAAELEPLVEPNLESTEEAVHEQLRRHRAELRALLDAGTAGRAETAAAFGRLGQLYLLYDLADAAWPAFENARRLAPEDYRWSYYLGIIHQQRGELAAAAAAFARALEARPGDLPTLLHMGRVALDDGRVEDAGRWFERAHERGGSAAARYGLGQVALARGDLERAVELFETVLAEQPEASSVHYQLGLAYRQLGDLDKAREHLGLRGNRNLVFRDPLLDGLSQLVTGAGAFMDIGNSAVARGDFDQAITAYRSALEAAPGHLQAWQALASTLALKGDHEEALELYRELLEREPDNAISHYNVGNLHVALGDLDAAARHLARSAELAPDFGNALFNLATVLDRLGRTEEAAEQAARAVAAEPEERPVRLLHAKLLAKIGRLEEAEDALSELLAREPDDAEALLALGGALEEQGRTHEALETYGSVLDLPGVRQDPDGGRSESRAKAHLLIGQLLGRSGESEESLSHLDAAAALAPDLSEVHLALAAAHGQARRFAAAAASYARAVELDPAQPSSHFGRGTALLLAGREADARRALEESLERLPESLSLRHALARLLAAAEDPAVRDGERALELATEVFQGYASVEHGQTVAMAHAELGRFEDAVTWQRRIIQRAEAVGREDVLPELREHLASYLAGEPVRAPWGGDLTGDP